MQEQEHTPGPWIATRCDDGTMMVHTEGDIVAGIMAFGDRGALDEANARLIAAAPDLLLALAWLHDLEQGRRPDEYADQKALAMAAARAAIVKATGAALPAPPAQGGDKTEDTLDGQ